jgi:transposase
MKVTQIKQTIKLDHVMDVAFDVHKDLLYCAARTDKATYQDLCRNNTPRIEKQLRVWRDIAESHGLANIRVICEPTGMYDRKLLRTARRLGCLTTYVNTEAVAKYRVIETNDPGKTDTKDPFVIGSVARQGKTIRIRTLPEDYVIMRKLGKIYDEQERQMVRTRVYLNQELLELFCDYDFGKDFLYSTSGRALIKKYHANPYSIVNVGQKRFCNAMKKAVPRIRRVTLEKLWEQAKISVLHELPDEYLKTIDQHFMQLWHDFERFESARAQTTVTMEKLLKRLRKEDPNIPAPNKQVISDKNLARLIGETGPLYDFDHWRQLMRYSGLNIVMRQSGKYTGQFKISKRGRPMLRKILQNIVLPLVPKHKLFGEFYHHKKDTEKMPGNKAMTVTARMFLRKFFGWYKSGQEFNLERFTVDVNRPAKAAA